MKSINLELEKFKKLAVRGIFLVENRTKYKNENRDFAALALFVFSLVLIPELMLFYGLMTMPIRVNGLVFFTLLSAIEIWLFKYGWDLYRLHKDPITFFWPYFRKKYVKLVLLGTHEINGSEYVSHHFITDNRYALTKCNIYVEVNIRKDIHQKAMDLNKKVYDIAFDKHGNRKFVSMDGAIEDADEDVMLVARFINALYALYGEDIHQLKIETDAETRRRERL